MEPILKEEILKTINENSEVKATFNIMPDKIIEEKFLIKEFRIGTRFIEATFDRKYLSEMNNSPSHVTMTVIPLLTQKICYAWLCHELNFLYEPNKKELLKIWPTWLEFKYPKLEDKKDNITYTVEFQKFKKIQKKRYFAKITSTVENTFEINAEAHIIIL